MDIVVRGKNRSVPGRLRATTRVPASLLGAIRKVPGVRIAEGSVSGYAQIVTSDGTVVETQGAPTLGVNWIADPGLSSLRLDRGQPHAAL